MRTMTILTAVSAALLAAGCASGPADGSGASVVEDTDGDATEVEDTDDAGSEDADTEEAVRETEGGDEPAVEEEESAADADEVALGTRGNPLEVGTRIEMGDWTLTVTEVTLDATEQVMSENEFNDPPVEGRQFVLFTVDATYEGEESGTAWLDFSWAIVGSAGNTFGTAMDDYCGVIPNPLDDTGETFPGGNVAGNVCVSVDSEQVDGATIRIEESLSFDDTRAFYALN